ncbi:MAG: 4-hydroxy-tetrahydrodipicolinate reductase [Verrucomicrobiae bacterium]|nr:4-hydroxy-tetrahydrodipicolinate reductase [Verrucomicrobiae bacterium]
MPVKIVMSGCQGRMGKNILECARADQEVEVAGQFDKDDDPAKAIQSGVVVIDFSFHSATPGIVKAALAKRCPLVIGTTGLTDAERQTVTDASREVAVVYAPNMSVGVNLLFALTEMVAGILKSGYDIEIIEKHHRHKKDSPSGTADKLAKLAAKARGLDLAAEARHGRQGMVGERTADEIGIHAIRGGDYVGEHTVIFASEGEVVELTHKASSRLVFARGAVVAAKWANQAKPGLYDMLDVLGLRLKNAK